ncbi:Hfq-related RNA-binding protein, partial [Klebsiella pneumoniae]|uniref:Hfq-related RNA-binding protein n=1 Tax=Klebsiella pneumoniae TaxID=573 RepID=UPI0021D043CE
RQVQSFIKSQKQVEIKLTSGEAIVGKVRWQDPDCIALVDENNQQTLVWRQALAYLKPKD